MRRAACAEWPRILNPAPGCFPPAAPLRQDERVLHVALHPDADLTQVLPRAFAKIASAYGRVDWQRADTSPGGLAQALESEARRIRPTLVWMQMQGPSSLDEPGASPLPAQIILFLENIWDVADGAERPYRREIRKTLLHELGHSLGWEEAELEARHLD